MDNDSPKNIIINLSLERDQVKLRFLGIPIPFYRQDISNAFYKYPDGTGHGSEGTQSLEAQVVCLLTNLQLNEADLPKVDYPIEVRTKFIGFNGGKKHLDIVSKSLLEIYAISRKTSITFLDEY